METCEGKEIKIPCGVGQWFSTGGDFDSQGALANVRRLSNLSHKWSSSSEEGPAMPLTSNNVKYSLLQVSYNKGLSEIQNTSAVLQLTNLGQDCDLML